MNRVVTNEKVLWRAIEVGNEGPVREFLDAGGDPQDVLRLAAEHGQEKLVALLISKGARAKGSGALHGACFNCKSTPTSNYKEVVRLLLEAGAKPNTKHPSYANSTPLHAVCGDHHQQLPMKLRKEIIRMLVDAGGDLLQCNDHGASAIFMLKEVEAVKFLIDDLGLDASKPRNAAGQTPLFVAKTKGMMTLLLERGVDPMVTDNDGQLAIHTQARAGRLTAELIPLLLGKTDANLPDAGGFALLHVLVAQDRMGATLRAAVAALLEQGASLEARDNKGLTPLFYAQEVAKARFLIEECGADVTAKDNEGSSLLFRSTDPKLTQYYFDKGLDINARNDKGQTPLHAASGTERGYSSYDYRATYSDSCLHQRLLLDLGAEVDARDNEGKTPLSEAKCDEKFASLCEYGADITAAPSRNVWCALHLRVQDLFRDTNEIRLPKRLLWWILTRMDPKLVQQCVGKFRNNYLQQAVQKAKTPDKVLQIREKRVRFLKDDAFDRRKLLVHCYFETRRIRREGGVKKQKTEEEAKEEGEAVAAAAGAGRA